ncbi:MAG TPA: type I glyceraldehyde-3-phosphate dehydrogenase [Oligoflexia bacterium]|nr:type I glyceraldehyde-3-phosphate dehydrogenase [Oligoflexia bacterium]HMP47733.1 type I glyceraldehyde-3-phosphate dehydrogenase [Oligoflexia bacterium]
MAIKFAINGFGRIGRNVVRAMHSSRTSDFELVAINDLTTPDTLAHLLKYDSVHGKFEADISVGEKSITINGKSVAVSAEKDPTALPWSKLGVDAVFECTGIFTKKPDAEKHIQAGAKKVLISAPANDSDITIVYGVNHQKYNNKEHNVISNGSCTTNCLAPVAKVLMDNFGISHGMMTTIHSYTNDQNILDLPHKDLRRARAASLSMIPTTTGAAKALGLVIPELKGKMDGLAVRVPTPNVSLVDLVCQLEKNVTIDEVNSALINSANGSLKGILAVTNEPLVSCDFNGSSASSTVDLSSTMLMNGNTVKVLSWYDNEMGFSYRMLDVLGLLFK